MKTFGSIIEMAFTIATLACISLRSRFHNRIGEYNAITAEHSLPGSVNSRHYKNNPNVSVRVCLISRFIARKFLPRLFSAIASQYLDYSIR